MNAKGSSHRYAQTAGSGGTTAKSCAASPSCAPRSGSASPWRRSSRRSGRCRKAARPPPTTGGVCRVPGGPCWTGVSPSSSGSGTGWTRVSAAVACRSASAVCCNPNDVAGAEGPGPRWLLDEDGWSPPPGVVPG